MTSAELSEWMQYYTIEPFGQWRDNWHAATLAAMLFNINRAKGQQAAKASDFMYMDQEAAEQKRDAETLALLRSVSG